MLQKDCRSRILLFRGAIAYCGSGRKGAIGREKFLGKTMSQNFVHRVLIVCSLTFNRFERQKDRFRSALTCSWSLGVQSAIFIGLSSNGLKVHSSNLNLVVPRDPKVNPQ